MAGTISIRMAVEQTDTLKSALEGIRGQGVGVMNAIADAAQKVGPKIDAALNRAAKGGGSTVSDAERASVAFNKLVLSVDPAERALIAYEAAQRTAAAAVKNGVASQDEANSVVGMAKTRYDDVVASINKAVSATQAMGSASDSARLKFDPLYAASKRYSDSTAEIAEAQKTGALTAGQAQIAQDNLNKAFAASNQPLDQHGKALGAVAASSGAAAAASRNLSIQVIQGVSGIATGQPILTTLIQQGHQVADSALAMGTGFGGVATAAKDMAAKVGSLALGLVSLPGAAGLAVAGLVAMAVVSESNASRMAILGQQLRATHDDYAALAVQVDLSARKVAASTSASTKEALSAAQTIAGAKYYAGTAADMDVLLRKAVDLSRALGVDLKAGAETIRGALDDTAAAAKKAADQGLTGFSAAVVRNIDLLQTGGQRAAAFKAYIDALGASVDGADKKSLTPFNQAMHDLGEAFYGSRDGGKSFADVIGGPVLTALTAALNVVTRFVEGIKSIPGAIKGMGDMARDGVQFDNDNNPVPGTGRPGTTYGPPAPTATGGTGVTASVTDYDRMRDRIAIQVGLDPQALRRVQTHEGVLLPNGTWKDSPTGPVGPMQVAAGTFQEMQRKYGFPGSQRDPEANTYAGAYYLRENIQRGRGDLATGYLGYHDGPGVYRPGANPSADALSTAAKIGTGYTGTPVTSAGMVNETRAASDAVADMTKNTRALKAEELDKQLAATGDQMVRLEADGQKDSAAYKALVQRTEELTAARYNNVDAQTAATRADQSALRATAGMFEGEQALNAALEKRHEIARTTGSPFGTAEEQAATTAELARQSQAYDRVTTQMAMAIGNNRELAASYDKGSQSVIDVTARQQAYEAALKQFPANTAQFADAYRTQIDLYKQAAKASAEAGVAQQNAASRDNLAYIQAETATVGLDTEARTKLLAVMKAEQEMHRKFGDVLPKEAQDYVALAGRTADATIAFQHQQATLGELSGFATSTFDTISTAITGAFATGQKSAVKFGDIARSVLSSLVSEMIKLAAINPLKNALFGTNSTTLADVGGLLGKLAGSGDATLNVSNAATTSALSSLGTGADGKPLYGPAQGGQAAAGVTGAAQSGSLSLSNLGSLGSLAVKGVNLLLGDSALSTLSSAFTNSITAPLTNAIGGALGGSTTAGVESLISTGFTPISNLSAEALSAANNVSLATNAVGAGGEAAGGAAAGAAGGAASSVLSAIPYVAAAYAVYQIGQQFAAGDVKGGLISLAIGSTFGALFKSHPENPYQNTEIDVKNGQLVAGKQVSQRESTTEASKAITSFSGSLNGVLDKLGLRIANPDGMVGNLGNNIKGLTQVDNPAKVLAALQFGAADPTATDNFSIAKQGLRGMSFTDLPGLTGEVAKLASFADASTALGLQLESVGRDLTSIRIASVDLGRDPSLDGLQAVDGPDNRSPFKQSDFRTALQHDLPGQTFADSAALDAEITKVNNFVNGTLPSLTNPVFETTSALMKQIGDLNKTYADAAFQAKAYGLATEDLTAAQAKAIATLQAPELKKLELSNLGIAVRGAAARGEDASGLQLQQFDIQASQQRDALAQQFKDIYGSLIPDAEDYGKAAATLDRTLAAERLKLLAQFGAAAAQAEQQAAQQRLAVIQAARQAEDAQFSVDSAFWSIRGRQAALLGDNRDSDVGAYNLKAIQESTAYSRQLLDFYGQSFASSTDYHNRMSELETVQQGERLAIIKKYGDQGTATTQASAQAIAQAQTNVAGVLTSLTDYARKLQTSQDSPLSAQSQYSLASSQFSAVSGAAAAGDYRSASQLSTYADTFLAASRSVNGSGTGYADDFGKVIAALQGVASAGADQLTASAMADIAKQANAPVVSAIESLEAQVVALRREVQQQGRKVA